MDTPFNERGVSVTRNAFSAAGQVFALREIEGVRVVTIPKNKALPTTISLIGLAGAIAGGVAGSGAGFVLGVMLIVVGILAWFTQDVTHRLMLKTASGERDTISSVDLDFVERVAQAVTRAKDAAVVASGPAA
ncbi:DUF6232 family protein [Paraburkholderia phosphatilytica]|uniref:DUF6232 family protein n=1 Tax=Paraburkholderia phosphatilytica TaxID=2282883 RepID=UPI000E4EF995|nr:DUF6232 family protein [Paraburkholderia phosphatilytica]